LNNWKFRRLGEVQPGSLENPPRVNEKSASAVKIGRAIPSLALSSAVNRYGKPAHPHQKKRAITELRLGMKILGLGVPHGT
jgi:hypothetical protein